ncbi:diguanylate cyclase [Pseudomonas mosselii]|uniref:sensor domain-containing diguanylate cyclase n=1 Tax=Pseudomonas mosselii TaxID=78327 RepID=UPI0007701014|nr:diguanylate cyclase [Pseudomonas mosselii]AMK29692.1 GGDEF domain protein [Pseudomonas putida]MBC3449772.1 diguanylate cyclase [Pseudomonas mosselii]MDH1100025.1 diguanylate cyclase [Pseudomonas mosselii]MDH1656605.1 diguanylate cyclase [Pseudomonas mosselii]MDH1715063.1 diguanylate cyclase [Pseudomonas mosselii]
MPSPSALFSQRSLIIALLLLLAGGFLATSLLGYYASRGAIRDGIVNTELPLTSDTVYSEIQKDLIRPVLIASMMAQDTFLRDWVLAGEQDTGRITRYLGAVMGSQATCTSFFVSDRSLTYYQAKGVLKQVRADAWRDAWYFRLRQSGKPYEINVDVDMANQDKPTVFINHRVLDYQQRFIGAAGVGLSVESVVRLIDDYQRRYQRSVLFTDAGGKVLLTGSDGGPHGLRAGQQLADSSQWQDLLARMPTPASGSHEYTDNDGHSHFLNVRLLPELDWYLLVDKRETGALDRIRQSLYLNLAICAMITLVVLSLLNAMIKRHQDNAEALATLDSLTGLPNRRSFDLLAGQALIEAQRDSAPLVALLIDLDHFKTLNDTHGHLAGDEVLRQFANVLQGSLRQSDILCRWGGEEFIVLLREAEGRQAIEVAEKIRRRTEQLTFSHADQPLRLTVSIGLSALQRDDSLHSLLTRADHALYRAKQGGRNRVCSEMPGPDHA